MEFPSSQRVSLSPAEPQIHDSGISVTGGITVSQGIVNAAQGIDVAAGGVSVANGASIFDGGLSVTDGLTVGAGGLVVTDGGATVTNTGLAVTAGGMTVSEDGLVVTAGGLSVQAGGVSMTNGGLTVNGDVELATNPTVYSDRRLKTNITRIEGALNMIQALHGVKYSWLQLDFLSDREEDAASIGRTH